MARRGNRDAKPLGTQGANERHQVVVGRLAAGNPHPTVAGIRRCGGIAHGGDFLLAGAALDAVIGIAAVATYRTARKAQEAHLEAAQVAFALDSPEYRVWGKWVYHCCSPSPATS